MKRLFVLAVLLLAACARPIPQGVTELTYATPYPPSHPFSRADQDWIRFVEQASGGSLRIRPIWSGALLSSDMSLEELRHGVADIGLITPIYARGGTRLIRSQTGYYSGADTIASQVALYHCIETQIPRIDQELAGLKVLAVQGGLLPGIATSERRVRNLSDLKGMRIRVPTELMTLFDNLGADPVNMPMGDVYSALAKGVIDGVVAPIDTFKTLHFAEVTRYYNTLKVPRGAYPSRAIGRRSWARLSPAQQRILERSIPVWESALAREIGIGAEAGAQAAQQGHVQFVAMPDAQQAEFDALYLRDAERDARSLSRFGIDGLKTFHTARASIVGRNRINCGAAK